MKLFGNFFGPKKENPEEQTGEQKRSNVIDFEEKRRRKEYERLGASISASELADKILEKNESLRREQRLAEAEQKAEALEHKE
jgi:hypothetical protein